jgi:hypothetical protein
MFFCEGLPVLLPFHNKLECYPLPFTVTYYDTAPTLFCQGLPVLSSHHYKLECYPLPFPLTYYGTAKITTVKCLWCSPHSPMLFCQGLSL